MKNKKIFLVAAGILFSSCILAQQHGYYGSFVPPFDRSPHHLILTINPQDGVYFKKDLNTVDYLTEIHGEKILGTPYLLFEWSNGSLTTINGGTYYYPLRYNVYEQLVSFYDGKDSLEITDEIKEFSLSVMVNDTAVLLQFVNANQYKKESKTFYYQLILNSKKGQLLKTNSKEVNSLTAGLLAQKGRKYFELKCEYYYFDANAKQIFKINDDGSNLKKVLNVTEEKAALLQMDSYHFSSDEELIKFFKNYFTSE